MKKLLTTIIVAASAFMLTGCDTIKSWFNTSMTDEASLSRICATAESLSQGGAIVLVSNVPEAKEPILIVANALEVLLQTENVAPTEIDEAIKKALDDTDATEQVKTSVISITNTVIAWYSAVYKANIDIHHSEAVKGCIKILGCIATGWKNGANAVASSSNNTFVKTASSYKDQDFVFLK